MSIFVEVEKMNVSDNSIFEILGGGRKFSDSEKKIFIDAVENAAWTGFLRKDAPSLMMPADYIKVLEIQRDWGPDDNVCDRVVAFMKETIPDVQSIIAERAIELKMKLVAARIADFSRHSDVSEIKKLYAASNWEALAKRLKAINTQCDPLTLLQRVGSVDETAAHMEDGLRDDDAQNDNPEERLLRAVFGEQYHSQTEDIWSVECEQASEKHSEEPLPDSKEPADYDLAEAVRIAVENSPVIAAEKEFLSGIDKNVVFSYRIGATDKLLNGAIADALSEALRGNGREVPKHAGFKSVRDFKTVVERYNDREFEYETLRSALRDSVLCVEDFDLMPVLSPKEFKKFLDFFRSEEKHMFFFFGDFISAPTAFPALMRDFEITLNMRCFDAGQVKIDETGILESAFEADGLSLCDDARASLTRAWAAFRLMRSDEKLDRVMKDFISKSRFSSFVENGHRVLKSSSFAWIGGEASGPSAVAGPNSAALLDLEKLVGMASVKTEIKGFATHALVSHAKAAAGMAVESMNMSFLFLGNPGTGKTTVARILARELKELGLLKKGHLVTASRGTLIGQYLGQTAPTVIDTFMSAIDGVLFVDEAYALHNSDKSMDSYGREAINTLTLLMSEFDGRIAVIFAGYEEEMDSMFESINPGLRDRFAHRIKFGDYAEYELWEIFKGRLKAASLALECGADEILKGEIARIYARRDKRFGNARTVNNLFQSLVRIQERRLADMFGHDGINPAELATVRTEDCENLLMANAHRYSKEERLIGFAG
jgi:Cdc6-like AAA superfamily ATPase